MADREMPTIECAKDGPFIVKNLTSFTGFDGSAVATKTVMALCRCGASKNKPFCDGTHAAMGFTDERLEDRVPDKRDAYDGKRITIHDNRGICCHAAHCTDRLKEVFRTGEEPWIDADGADVKKIVEVIAMCPSGALSYSMGGVEHHEQPSEPGLHVTPHGPYRVTGGVELQGTEFLQGVTNNQYTLCRCGASKNKPFCDGSHWGANFRDDSKRRVATLGDLEKGDPVAFAMSENVAVPLSAATTR